jgi:hypothetical protein
MLCVKHVYAKTSFPFLPLFRAPTVLYFCFHRLVSFFTFTKLEKIKKQRIEKNKQQGTIFLECKGENTKQTRINVCIS